ncbi:TrkH family potassium uptake protein [Aerococcaceae bacterium WGS1372]
MSIIKIMDNKIISKFVSFLSDLDISKKIALSFFMVILVGSLLLSMPISQVATSEATYFDHLFITVSAACVTGLFIESIFETYNFFGQVILMCIIQIGGLGLMSFLSIIYFRLGQFVGIRNQMAVTSALNSSSLYNIKDWLSKIFKYTFIIEGLGACLYAIFFIPYLGLPRGIFTSIFMAVSAFCNAGFDPLSNLSLIPFQNVGIINWTTMALIVLGGIGFSVWFDVSERVKEFYSNKSHRRMKDVFRKLQPHTKLSLTFTASLILIGATLFLIIEWGNQGTIGNLSIADKVTTSVFQTVTMRTAGFATVDYTMVRPISLVIFIATMFIGGSPGGTAGGVKTTTFALVIMLVKREIEQKEYINYAKHTIPMPIVRKALVIFVLYIVLLIFGSGLILLFDPQVDYLAILFESISAIATVGVTANLTSSLSYASQVVIMILMFVGRIGPMTMFVALLPNKNKHEKNIQYTSTNIIIG